MADEQVQLMDEIGWPAMGTQAIGPVGGVRQGGRLRSGGKAPMGNGAFLFQGVFDLL